MADIEKLQGQIDGLSKAMEGWKDSNNQLNKSIGGLNNAVDGLQRPLDGLTNRIRMVGDDLFKYNKTVLETSRSLEIFGGTLNKYQTTLTQVSTSTRYSRQETAELANVFSKGILGEKDLSLFREYVTVLDRMGLTSEEASASLGSLTTAQNKFADAHERIKAGGLAAGELLELSPEDARNISIYTKEIKNMNGGIESSKSPIMAYNNSIREMQKNVTNLTLSMQQSFGPVLENIAQLVTKLTPYIEKVSDVIGNVLSSSIAASLTGFTALFAAFTIGIKKALELGSAFAKMPKIMNDVASSTDRMTKSVRADIAAEKEKTTVAKAHSKGLDEVGRSADETAKSEETLAESGKNRYGPTRERAARRDKAQNRLNLMKKKRGVRGKFRGTKASLLKMTRKGGGGFGKRASNSLKNYSKNSLSKSNSIKKIGKNLVGGVKSLALPSLIVSMGLGTLAEMTKDETKKNSEQSNLNKGLGAASTAAAWGGTGAMIGSVIPGLGTVAGGAIGGVAGAGYSLYNSYIGDKKKEDALTAFEKSVGGNRGVEATDAAFESDAKKKMESAKSAAEIQDITTEKLKRQEDLYTSLKEKAEAANDPEKAAAYAEKLDDIKQKITDNIDGTHALTEEIRKQNETIAMQEQIFGGAANAAQQMASMYADFYFDGTKAEESLLRQTEHLKEQTAELEKRANTNKIFIDDNNKIIEQTKIELKNEKLTEKEKEELNAKLEKAQKDKNINLAKQEKIELEAASNKQKIDKAELESLTKKLDVEQKIHEVKLAQADAAERLAKESMLGIGYSAEAAKQSFDESTNVARVATEKANVLQKEVASLKAQEQAARASDNIEEANRLALKLNNLKVKADEAQTEALNKQGDAMAKLNKLREGYLDSLQEMSFGVGEVSLIPTQDSGLATMSAGAARFGGKGEGRISPAASITGTGGVIKTSGDSGGGNSVYGFRDQEARFFGGPGGVDNRMQNLFNNAGAISNAYGANAAARQQAGPMKEGTTVIVNASPSGVSVGKHDSSNVSVSTKFV